MKETIIYIIRHAEAEGNLYRRMHGQYNSNVTEKGLLQIKALEERFREIPVDAVYASDLNRTVRTAVAVAAPRNLTILPEPRFREINAGVWEDATFGELAINDAKQMDNYKTAPKKWCVEGAERYEEYTGRFLEALNEVVRKHSGETIVIFTHGTVSSQALQIILPDAPNCHMDNTAVSRIRWDGSFHLDFLGDNSHLTEEISTLARQNWWRGDGAKPDLNLWYMPYETEIDWYLRLTDDSIPVAPMAVIDFAMLGKEPIGLIQMDPQRDQEVGAGFIDYIGLDKKHRGQRLGVQLIGAAVSYYRQLGRKSLRVCLPERFRKHAGWFEKFGFVAIGNDLYELNIQVPNGK